MAIVQQLGKSVTAVTRGETNIEMCWEKGRFYESQKHGMLSGCEGSVPHIDLQGKVVIDVGANIGNHSLFFAGVMGAQVLAIEPQPSHYDHLLENIKANHELDIDARHLALGSKSGKVKMVNSRVRKGTESDMVRLDTLISAKGKTGKINSCALLKIDVEGHEFQVLRGAKRLLTNLRPIIFVETDDLPKMTEYLAEFNYKGFVRTCCGGKEAPFAFNATATYRFDPA